MKRIIKKIISTMGMLLVLVCIVIWPLQANTIQNPDLVSYDQQDPIQFDLECSLSDGRGWKPGNLEHPEMALVGPDGLVYVIDRRGVQQRQTGRSYSLAVFSMDGRLIRRIGSDGEWPQQFRRMVLQGFQGNSVLIHDAPNHQLITWTVNGGIPRPHRLRDMDLRLLEERASESDQIVVPSMHLKSFGGVVLDNGNSVTLEVPHWIVSEGVARATIHSSNGDTIALIETDIVQINTLIPVAGRMEPYDIPFGARPQIVCLPDRGILTSTGWDGILSWYDFNGRLVETLEIPVPQQPPSTDDIAHFERYRDMRLDSDDRLSDRMKNRIRMLWLLPEQKARWSAVFIDDFGYYWLRLPEKVDRLDNQEDGFHYHIVNPDGLYLGITEAPYTIPATYLKDAALPVPVANGYFAAAIVDPTKGGPDIRLYRISVSK